MSMWKFVYTPYILSSCYDLCLAKTPDYKDIQSWSHLVQSYHKFDRFSFCSYQSVLAGEKKKKKEGEFLSEIVLLERNILQYKAVTHM